MEAEDEAFLHFLQDCGIQNQDQQGPKLQEVKDREKRCEET